jgi:segregation and condensation protein B
LDQTDKLKEILEAALLTNNQPLSIDDFQRLFIDKVDRSTIRMILDEIKNEWQDKTMDLVQVSTGYRFQSKAIFSEFLGRLSPDRIPKYSRAVMEVLAIIAYRQPVTRGEIEKIRGVSLNPNALRQLMEREWVDIIGQKEVPGRPSLYATTKHFLNDFGLNSISELPDINNLIAEQNHDVNEGKYSDLIQES